MSAPTNLSAFLSSISTEQFAALSAALEKEAAQQASSVMPLSPLTGLAKVKKEAVPVSPEAATAEISNKVPDDSTTQDLLAAIGSHRNEDGELTGAKEIKEEAPEMTTVDSEEDVPKTPKRRAEDDSKASEAKKVRSNIEESSLQHTDTSGSGPSIANTPILNGVINNESLAKLLLQNFHNQNFSSLLEPSAESSTKFTEVPSRLSLLTSSTKHVMSVDEVRRRIDGAENFNLSLLGSLFRRAKTPNMSEHITEQLKEHGLDVPKGRRRKTELTLFSAFTEGETTKMASDFKSLSSKFFPTQQMAEHINKTENKSKDSLVMFRDQIQLFMNLLRMDSSPVMFGHPPLQLDEATQAPLSLFSLLSHGFGIPGILVGVETMMDVVNEQIAQVEQREQFKVDE